MAIRANRADQLIGVLLLTVGCSAAPDDGAAQGGAPAGGNQDVGRGGKSGKAGGGSGASAGSAGSSTGGNGGSSGSAGSSTGGFSGSAGSSTGGFSGSAGGSGGVSGGSGGSSGVSGSSGFGGSGNGGGARPPCVDKASEVIVLGDSYVTGAASPALQPTLGGIYPPANQFRNYAVAGTSMASGGLAGLIPPQLDLAIALDPKISLVIMDGAGNDILLCDALRFPGCNTVCNRAGSSTQKVCTDIVSTAFDATKQLLQKMAAAGISDVVYFFYPHVPSNFGGFKEIIDYAEPLAKALCDGTAATTGNKLSCHFIDLVQPFSAAGGDMNPLNFSIDGIHPSQAGQNIIAQQILNVMQSRCLGQPASSACCQP